MLFFLTFFCCDQHFYLFSHTTSQHNIHSKQTKQQNNRQKTKNKSFLNIITYIKEKTLPSINSGRLGPLIRAVVHSQVTICRRLWIQYVFPHMCGVNQFCIIVFFAAVKPANNILFCIELIQRPESSSRRHKLGLTDQSICSKEDKTRFTCVHRLNDDGTLPFLTFY